MDIPENSPSRFSGLNPQQKQAVEASDRPLLIVAGAGTGKTHTLMSRLQNLLRRGIPGDQICALTLTNKAARVMIERVVGSEERRANSEERGTPFIGTFHAFGARLLRFEARLLGRTADFAIFDHGDAMQLMKKLFKRLEINPTRFSPAGLLQAVSRIKEGTAILPDPDSADPKDQVLAQIWAAYEQALQENNAFDLDDLVYQVVQLCSSDKMVCQRVQKRTRYLLIDEYQDLNNMQYEMVRLMAGATGSVTAVGDDHQCVPPDTEILTSAGPRPIREIRQGNRIWSASGNGGVCSGVVKKVKKFFYRGSLVKITTARGQTLRLTPNHIIFLRLKLCEEIYYVYLMYRSDRGFRLGLAKGARKVQGGVSQIGLRVRSNQERGDKMWIVRVCASRGEAQYWEAYLSFQYGIPTTVFDTGNRSMLISQDQVDRLFQNIDTVARVKKLMADHHLYFNWPHYLPQGGIRFASHRLRLRLTMFDDKRKSKLHPWGLSRLSINTRDQRLKEKVAALGLTTRRGKYSDWRTELTNMDSAVLENWVRKIKPLDPGLETVRTARLTAGPRMLLQPAAHARPSMQVAVKIGGRVVEDEIKKVEWESYRGWVYDLEVAGVHNYTANRLVVHNSIYRWRGSNFEIFLNFEQDWPEAQVVLLEKCYRSSANIIRAASALIAHNRRQKAKSLWTENPQGELIRLAEFTDEDQEAKWVAENIAKSEEGRARRTGQTTAILYRTNAQSRALEQALLERDVPYQIFGGLKFYERREVKDILAALKVIANPKDLLSTERLEKVLTKQGFKNFLAGSEGLASQSPSQVFRYFLSHTRYLTYLEHSFPDHRERRENIAELLAFARSFPTISDFLEKVALVQDTDADSDKRQATSDKQEDRVAPVALMTLHAAKGLEFDRVFIVGCKEELVPHVWSLGSDAELEEERRLLYVGMTRARHSLTLSYFDIPSRFLGELPPELLNFESRAEEEDYITIDD
ncbi:MAG: UvrD-helicase domain-containing protein [Candidatus Liptonbacteria bacterium]|nr:UvrD-helicase domain-containing protein [Candidatus Liptonbacteria bacterium]